MDEGSYEFWKTVFDGVATCGRKVEIDMHAKGMDQTHDRHWRWPPGCRSRSRPSIGPSTWACRITRPIFASWSGPRPGREATGLMKFSAGSRSFLRYGYGDLLREDRRWGVLHRIWPGTQRLLLWGDPLTAAAHSRAFSFCGSDGVEIMEPLSFKGRRGSGIAGDRCAYADTSLKPRWDWEKYEYSHRVWGRLLYNPELRPEGWRRYLRKHFGEAGAGGSRRLWPTPAAFCRSSPPLTVPSAANNTYWPEVYLNQSMIDAEHPGPIRTRPRPRCSATSARSIRNYFRASTTSPTSCSRASAAASTRRSKWRNGSRIMRRGSRQLGGAAAEASGKDRPEYRRMAIDVDPGGARPVLRREVPSGVLYRIYEQTGDRAALEDWLKPYRAARAAWAELANRAKASMFPILRSGNPQLRGHWLDRLPAIDTDIALVAARLEKAGVGAPSAVVESAIAEALGRPVRAEIACAHVAPSRFRPGHALELEIAPAKKVAGVRLFYRHVTQAERFESVAMTAAGSRWRGAVQGAYSARGVPHRILFRVTGVGGAGYALSGIWWGAGEYALFCGSLGGVALRQIQRLSPFLQQRCMK